MSTPGTPSPAQLLSGDGKTYFKLLHGVSLGRAETTRLLRFANDPDIQVVKDDDGWRSKWASTGKTISRGKTFLALARAHLKRFGVPVTLEEAFPQPPTETKEAAPEKAAAPEAPPSAIIL